MKEEDWDKIRIGNFLIDTWLLTPFKSTETGVDVRIWISLRQCISKPFLIIAPNPASIKKQGIVISIDRKPKILAPEGKTIEPKVWQQLVLWIKLNRQGLYLHWTDIISPTEFDYNYMKKI